MEDLNVQTIAIPVEEYKELLQKQAELSLIYHKGAGGSVYDMRFRRGMENVSSEEIFGAKRYANTMHYAPKLTETRLRLNTGSRSACCSTAGSKSRTKSANPAAGRARRLTKSESSSFEHPA